MNELEPRARAIVEAARGGDLPTAVDRDRIKRAIVLQLAAGGLVASTATATATAGGLSVAAKTGLAIAAVTLVGGGAVGVWHARSEGPTPRPAAALVVPATTAAVPTRPEPAPTAPAPVAPGIVAGEERIRKGERARRLAPANPVAFAPPPDQLAGEVEVLKRARDELREDRPLRALEALAEYDRRFGGAGALREERQAIAAIAGCRAQPGAQARARAQAFLRAAPASPLRQRVIEACIPGAINREERR